MKIQIISIIFLLLQLLHTSCNQYTVTEACYNADSLYVQGISYERFDSAEQAVTCYRRAMALIESNNCDPHLYIQIKLQLADLLLLHTYYERASVIYKNTLQEANEIEDLYLSSRSLRGIGKCMIFKNKADSALYYIKQALLFVDDIDDNKEVAALYNNMSSVYCDLEQYDEAIRYNNLSLHTGVDSTTMGKSIANQAYLYLMTEQYDSAKYYAQLCYDNYTNQYTQISALETLYTIAMHYNSKDTADYTAAYTTITSQLTTNAKTAAIADAEQKLSEEFLRKQLDNTRNSTWVLFALVALSVGGWVVVFFLTRGAQKSKFADPELSPDEIAERSIAAIVKRGEEYAHLFKESVAYNNMLAMLEKQDHLSQQEQQRFTEAVTRVFAPFIEDIHPLCLLTTEQYVMCCFSLIGLTNQQCAACRNVSENAIRTQKSRIKSKMTQSVGDVKLFDAIFSTK